VDFLQNKLCKFCTVGYDSLLAVKLAVDSFGFVVAVHYDYNDDDELMMN